MKKELSPHAAAAKAIRTTLKRDYPHLKQSVTSSSYAGGNAVRVHIEDAKPSEIDAIDTLCNKHQYGSFDGMTDCYNYDNSNDDLPQVKYVQLEAGPSEELKQEIKEFLKNTFSEGDAIFNDYSAEWRQYRQVDSLFWKSKEKKSSKHTSAPKLLNALNIATKFIEELTKANGKYSEIDGTQAVADAYVKLLEIKEARGE